MKKQLSFFFAAAFLTVAASAEFPPWLPERRPVRKIEVAPAPFPENQTVKSLDGTWKISGLDTASEPFTEPDVPREFASPHYDDSTWDTIHVPDSWYLKYPDKLKVPSRPYVRGWYRRSFSLTEAELKNRRLILSFDAVAYSAKLFLNGKEIGSHTGDFTPFEVDATAAAIPGRNVLAVRVLTDSGKDGGLPLLNHAYGSNWIMKGGIWQSVRLRLEPEIRFASILVTPFRRGKYIEAAYRIINTTGQEQKFQLTGSVTSAIAGNGSGETGRATETFRLTPGLNSGTLRINLNNPVEWCPENPHLYYLTLKAGEYSRTVRFGFRDFKAENGKFYLNGREIYLFGQNISSVQYGGRGKNIETERKEWEQTVRNFLETGSRIIRTAHGPIPFWMLDVADEYGLMFYLEWGWCFSTNLDIPAFTANNNRELTEFIERAYNNPSVVMWCGGNEVRHADRPEIARLLNDQVRLIRSIDRSGRPVSVFSGAGGWYNYGENRLDTDVLDMHNYTGLYDPWTTMPDLFRRQLSGILRIYGDREKSSRPQIAWENVGYSWGAWTPDLKFRRGDVEQYAEYMTRPTTWALPNGVGFTGTVPLFKAVGPNFGEWAQRLYGHRIFEYFRLNPGFSGFAPWFPANDSSLLWNQPVYPSFLSRDGLFPRHFFSEEESEWNYTIVNDGADTLPEPLLEWFLTDRSGTRHWLGALRTATVPAHGRIAGNVRLRLPDTLTAGDYQLRLAVRQGDRLIGRNYYNIHVQPRSILTEKIVPARPVYILDTGAARNVEKLRRLLNDYGIEHSIAAGTDGLEARSVLIVPPESDEPQQLDLARDMALEHFIHERRGTLLVLEQKNLKTVFPGNLFLLPHNNTFVDMVSPEHPVFSGLDYWHFDTWVNPDHGFLIHHSLIPYTANAVMVKGPTISRTNLGTALFEAVNGRGRMIFSQLDAVANRERDSVAAKYLRNLLAYTTGGEYWREARPPASIRNGFEVKEQKIFTVDLAPYATTSFQDETDNDGKGGWTDQGENDFRLIPLGRQTAAGVPFHVLDPAKNQGRSCIVLRGSSRPNLPAAVRGIKIGKRLSRLFFLHTAGWGSSGLAGAYRMHYADGTSTDFQLQGRVNIGDWWQVDRLPEAFPGLTVTLPGGRTIGTYVACWDNPDPSKEVVSLDFLSESARRGNEVDWMPDNTPVPILIAITGETVASGFTGLLEDGIFTGASNARENGSGVEGKVTVRKNAAGRELDIDFPACGGNDVPAARIAFRAAAVPKDTFGYLGCWIKSSASGIIQLTLPCGNWEGSYTGELTLIGDGKWHKYRLRFDEDFRKWKNCSQSELRGELFLFSRSHRAPGAERPAMNFTMKDITLE